MLMLRASERVIMSVLNQHPTKTTGSCWREFQFFEIMYLPSCSGFGVTRRIINMSNLDRFFLLMLICQVHPACGVCYWHHQHWDPPGPDLMPAHARDPALPDLHFPLTSLVLRSINSTLTSTFVISLSGLLLGLISLKPNMSELTIRDF